MLPFRLCAFPSAGSGGEGSLRFVSIGAYSKYRFEECSVAGLYRLIDSSAPAILYF